MSASEGTASVRAGVGVSAESDPYEAGLAAARLAKDQLGGAEAELVLVFASGTYLAAPEALLEAVHTTLLPAVLIGCGAGGVLGAGRELEEGTAISVWAVSLAAGKARPFHCTAEPEQPHALIDPPVLDGASGVIMLADPYSFPADVALAEFARQAPGVPVLGGLASARTAEGGGALFFGAEVREHGAVGVSLHGVELLPCVSQGAAPLGPGMTVTAAEGNVIHELEGKPAIQALEEVAGALDPRERALLAGGLLVGIAIEEPGPDNEVGSGAAEQGDFLVRGVVGADPQTGSLAVGASIEPGSVVRLHARDPGSADRDLRDALRLRMAAIAGGRPAGALVFSCNGRGRGMFGAPDHDAQMVEHELAGAPAAGFFAAGEIGPVAGRNFLHGFTATIAVFLGEEEGARPLPPNTLA